MGNYIINNKFQVELSDLTYSSTSLLPFFVEALEKLGYEIDSFENDCITAKLDGKPSEDVLRETENNILKYRYNMPYMVKICVEGEIAKLDFNFFSNLGLFRNKSLLLKRIDNFITKIYELQQEISESELFSIQTKLEEIVTETSKQGGVVFTSLLILAYIIYYLLVVIFNGANFFDIEAEILIKSGGNFPTKTLNGEWWRLLSSIFLHSDLEHLFANVAALISIGTLLEPRVGSLRFLVAFIVTGVIGAAISTINNHFVVSIGASGGILGLYAIFFVLLAFRRVSIRKKFFYDIVALVIFTLASGLVDPNVDNSGHLGGFISGVFVGLVFLLDVAKTGEKLKPITIFLPIIIGLAVSVYALRTTPDYRAKWLEILHQTDSISNTSQTFFGLLKDNPNASDTLFLSAINADIESFRKCLELIKSSSNLKLNETNLKLAKYMEDYYSTWLESYKHLKTIFSQVNYPIEVEDSLVASYLKLTDIIKKDTIITIPEVWIPHNFIYLFRLKKFSRYESEALKYYDFLDVNASKDVLINSLENGNRAWSECKNLLKGLDSLNIAPSYKEKIELLNEYVGLRISSYNALLDYYRNNRNEALEIYRNLEPKINEVKQKIAEK
ncbi:MAG: rhomboid family intramembrane serine protease [Ignavibacteria bacterium]|nr:rhomboid family intramembrane serine protease [Ignavibacteria bacterium]